MKKVLALVLAAMLVIGIAPLTFAAGDAYELGYSTSGARETKTADLSLGDITPANRSYYFAITDASGNVLTKAEVKSQKIDVKTKVSEGSKVIDGVTIQYAKNAAVAAAQNQAATTEYAYVRVRFLEFFVSTGDTDFRFKVYLTKDKKKIENSEFEITGNYSNASQEVGEDDDYVNLEDTPVVKATAYIKAIEVELGAGVTINAKFFNDKKYYGRAHNKVKSEDDTVLSTYPDIENVYYLETINLKSAGNTVNLGIDDKLYVYNVDLEYIGMSNEKLPYSTKYYVASKELDVESGDDLTDAPDSGDDYTEAGTNPDMGGDDVPENVNDNPGTGC